MTRPWLVTMELRGQTIWIWVSKRRGGNVLRAQLPLPAHPRGLLTMLEGLALCSGERILAVLGVDHPVSDSLGLGGFGGEDWPEQSALVQFFIRQPARPAHRLDTCEDCARCDIEEVCE